MEAIRPHENGEEIELESKLGRAARFAFLASLGFWPLFFLAVRFMLDAPLNSAAALIERKILVVDSWVYPAIVVVAWLLAKHGMRRGFSDFACTIPWVMPGVAASYWLIYFFL